MSRHRRPERFAAAPQVPYGQVLQVDVLTPTTWLVEVRDVSRYTHLERTAYGVDTFACRGCGSVVWDKVAHDRLHELLEHVVAATVPWQTRLARMLANMKKPLTRS